MELPQSPRTTSTASSSSRPLTRVAVYRFADDGQAAPVRTLSGITGAQGLLVDTDADQLFVLDDFGSMLHVFPRTASRAAAPLRTLNAAQGAFACEGFRMAICN